MAVLLTDRIQSCVMEIRYVNWKIFLMLMVKRESWFIIIVYAKGMESSEEGEGKFCEDLKGFIGYCEIKR